MHRYFLAIAILFTIGNTCLAQTHVMHDHTKYDLRVQRSEIKEQVITTDKKFLIIETVAMFYIKPKDVPFIHKKTGPMYATQLVPDIVHAKVHAVFGKYADSEIMSVKREDILAQLQENVQKELTPYRIQLASLQLTSIGYIPSVMQAITQKMISEEDKYRAENERKAAEIRLAAQKSAEIAKAERNAIISKGLDTKILQLRYIEALEKLAESPNAKIVIFGNGEVALPSFSPGKQTPKKK